MKEESDDNHLCHAPNGQVDCFYRFKYFFIIFMGNKIIMLHIYNTNIFFSPQVFTKCIYSYFCTEVSRKIN